MLKGDVQRAASLIARREVLVERQANLVRNWENSRGNNRALDEITVSIGFPTMHGRVTACLIPFTEETLEFLLGGFHTAIDAIDHDLREMGVEL